MANGITIAVIIYPLCVLLTVGLFFFVLKTPKDLGIYLGWIPSLVFLMLTMFFSLYCLIPLIAALAIYITATALRIENNRKTIQREEKRLKEIDKMSIDDL